MPFKSIASPNLAAAAATQIRDLIAKDVLHPGDQLPGERDLAQDMGISRTSLRTGLQTLVAEGLLISRQGAGFFVAKDLGLSLADPLISLLETSSDAVQDYLEFRKMLEGESAAFVATHGTPQEKQMIADIHAKMIEADKAGELGRTIELDREFHMAIVEVTGNVVSIQVSRSLNELLQQSVARSHSVAYGEIKGPANIVEQHQQILDAILARDPLKARLAQHDHLNHFANLLKSASDAQARDALVEQRKAWENRSKPGQSKRQ